MDDYLVHYGVLGMKWGVHKANQYDNNEKRVIKGAYSKKMKTLGYSPETIKLANKKIDEQYSEKKRLNKKESRRQMELSKFDPNMSKEDFVKSKYSKAKFKKYQTKKSEYDKRNMTRYKQDLALIAAGFVAPGPIVSDLMGWGAAIANEVRGRKVNKATKERLDSILNTEISSLSNKITDEDIDRLLKHREEDTMTSQDFNDLLHSAPMSGESFNDLSTIGHEYLEHYGRDGMHWGVRNGPPYPLNKEGLKAFRENRKKKREEKRRRKILNNPKKLAKHIDEFTPEELEEEAYRQQQYNAIGYQRKWGRNKIKLSRKQKRMSNNAVNLLNNMDKFNKDEYDAAVDRLRKREDLKNIIVDSANRPAQVLKTGADILGSVRSGIGTSMSMADMYKKAFGGATFDESHNAWLNNNKEPVSGKLWSQVIGESTAAQRGTKYEYKDEKRRLKDEEQARLDKLAREDLDRASKERQALFKNKSFNKQSGSSTGNSKMIDKSPKHAGYQLDMEGVDTVNLWTTMDSVPFEMISYDSKKKK